MKDSPEHKTLTLWESLAPAIYSAAWSNVEPSSQAAIRLFDMGNEEVLARLREFVAERDWQQFHTQENLAKSISIEAAELLECFQWGTPEESQQLEAELGDVLTYCFLLAATLGKDPGELIIEKLRETEQKYPADKARGRSTKYDRL